MTGLNTIKPAASSRPRFASQKTCRTFGGAGREFRSGVGERVEPEPGLGVCGEPALRAADDVPLLHDPRFATGCQPADLGVCIDAGGSGAADGGAECGVYSDAGSRVAGGAGGLGGSPMGRPGRRREMTIRRRS
jgi:hypothetical protein